MAQAVNQISFQLRFNRTFIISLFIFLYIQLCLSYNDSSSSSQSSQSSLSLSSLSLTQSDTDSRGSPPRFTRGPPHEMTILDGRDAEIQCEVIGDPIPSVEWFINGTIPIDPSLKSKYQINENGNLMIAPVESTDAATYTCVRSNKAGSINATTLVQVIVRTYIDQPPVDSKVILSSTAELQCRVRHDANVPVKLYWLFNGRNTTVNNRIKIMADGTLRIEQVNINYKIVFFFLIN